jgi:polysaccharide biosynthesis transport protein
MMRRIAPWAWQDWMFFDDATKRKPDGKARLRLAEAGGASFDDAAARHRIARMRREAAGPSLLDRQPVAERIVDEGATVQAKSGKSPTVTEQLAEIDRRNAETLRRKQGAARNADAPYHSDPDSPDDAASYPQSGRFVQTDEDNDWRSAQSHRDDGAPLIDPRFVFRAVRNWRALILAATMLGGLGGVYVALNTPKLYYSSATIVIDPRNYKVIENDLNPDVFLSEAALAIVDSQVSLMRSPRVLEKVSQKLALPNDPEFNGSGERGLGRFFGFLSGGDNQDYTGAALEYLAEHMNAERAPKTFVVSVGAYSEDGEKAALIANTIVDVYLEEQSTSRSDTAKRTSGELTARLENLRIDVEKAENAVEAFKAENNLIGAQGRLIEDEEILRVNDQLTAARSTTITLNARAQTAKSVTVDAVASGSLPEEIASTAITGLRSQYVGAKQRVDGLAAKLGPRHPDLQQASNEAESLRNAISAEINRIRQSIQTDLKRAVETEQSLAARLAQLKARSSGSGEAQVQLRELEREAASARTVYEQFLLRARETGEQGNINANNVQKISEARAADTPEGASRKLIVVGGIIAGFLAGLGLAMAKGMFDALKSRFNGGFSDLAPTPKPTAPNGGAPRRRMPQFFPAKDTGLKPAFTPSTGAAMPQPAARYQQPQFTPPPQYQHQMAQAPYVPQPVLPTQPYHHPIPIMQPFNQPAAVPTQPIMQTYGHPVQPMMQPAFSQPMMMFQPQMVPHQMLAVEQPSSSQREMHGIRETLDGLHAEIAELSRRRRSA